jgi:hypothetical protein
MVFDSVFGHYRVLAMIDALKQQGIEQDDTWLFMDRVGGTDGMKHALNEPKQYGGSLLHYLRTNLD